MCDTQKQNQCIPITKDCASESLAGLQLADQLQAKIRCFSESAPDATINFQIIDLGQQVYIWIAVGGAKFQNLFLAIQSKLDPNPAVATLLPDGASSGAAAMAQRLARRTGRSVVCSCNIPANADVLLVLAERRLCQELESMGLGKHSCSASSSAAAASTAAPAQRHSIQQTC